MIFRHLESISLNNCEMHGHHKSSKACFADSNEVCSETKWYNCPEIQKALDSIEFIAEHTKQEEESTSVSN